jgi:hypothetical protein
MSRRPGRPRQARNTSSDSEEQSASEGEADISSDEDWQPVLSGAAASDEDELEVLSDHADDSDEDGGPPVLHLPQGMLQARDGTIWDRVEPGASRR